MSRDYKSRGGASSKGGGSLILGIFIGYALGLVSAIGVWLYINQAPSPFLTEDKTTSRPKEEPLAKSTQVEKSVVNNTNSTNTAEESKSRFDFYKILPGIDEPDSGSIPNPKELAKASPQIDTTKHTTNNYFLQIGSFKSAREAEKVKAELAFLGMIAAIQATESSDKGTWYRVRMGPFSDIHEIDQVRASLQENQIESNIIRLPTSNMP